MKRAMDGKRQNFPLDGRIAPQYVPFVKAARPREVKPSKIRATSRMTALERPKCSRAPATRSSTCSTKEIQADGLCQSSQAASRASRGSASESKAPEDEKSR